MLELERFHLSSILIYISIHPIHPIDPSIRPIAMDDLTLAAIAAVLTTSAVLISMLWLARFAQPVLRDSNRGRVDDVWSLNEFVASSLLGI
jgi:hypothetical protein